MERIEVNVPDGKRGPWSISTFTVTDEELRMFNLRALMNGGIERMEAGTYKRLHHTQRGIVMSNTPMEIRTHYELFRVCRYESTKTILLNGLGLGMALSYILSLPHIEKITVIEIDKDVISLVKPSFNDSRVEIINADAFKWQPPKDIKYDVVWHDIWDTICTDHNDEMSKLCRKYGRKARWQKCWGRDEAKWMARR